MKKDTVHSTTTSFNAIYYTFARHVENHRPSYCGHQQCDPKDDEQYDNRSSSHIITTKKLEKRTFAFLFALADQVAMGVEVFLVICL